MNLYQYEQLIEKVALLTRALSASKDKLEQLGASDTVLKLLQKVIDESNRPTIVVVDIN